MALQLKITEENPYSLMINDNLVAENVTGQLISHTMALDEGSNSINIVVIENLS